MDDTATRLRLADRLLEHPQTTYEEARAAVTEARQEQAQDRRRRALRRLAWQLQAVLQANSMSSVEAVTEAGKLIQKLWDELKCDAKA